MKSYSVFAKFLPDKVVFGATVGLKMHFKEDVYSNFISFSAKDGGIGKIDVLAFGHKHVMGKWENRWNIPYILASDKSVNSKWAREIVITKEEITVNDINIEIA